MNIAIIDDVQTELNRLSDVIKEYMSHRHSTYEISSFHSAEEFLEDYRPLRYTLIFMDIYMGGMSGIDAAQQIRESDSESLIVFLTSSPEHTFDAFNIHAFQYILKTPDDAALTENVCKVMDDVMALTSNAGNKLSFMEDGTRQSMSFSNIVYVQSQKNYIQIIDRLKNTYRTRMTFSEINDILSEDNRFLRINRGIIINMDFITSFNEGVCVLCGEYQLPINQRDQKLLDNIRKNYIFSKLHSRRPGGEND